MAIAKPGSAAAAHKAPQRIGGVSPNIVVRYKCRETLPTPRERASERPPPGGLPDLPLEADRGPRSSDPRALRHRLAEPEERPEEAEGDAMNTIAMFGLAAMLAPALASMEDRPRGARLKTIPKEERHRRRIRRKKAKNSRRGNR